MSKTLLDSEREHLAGLLEAVQRCVYFLDASSRKLNWPLTAALLEKQNKDVALFESLAAINERFAKLQNTLGAAMRHGSILAGESGDTFLKVLSFYEKTACLIRFHPGNSVVPHVILPRTITRPNMKKSLIISILSMNLPLCYTGTPTVLLPIARLFWA